MGNCEEDMDDDHGEAMREKHEFSVQRHIIEHEMVKR